MTLAVADRIVPRKRKGDESAPRNDVAVKIDRDVVRYARTVASFKDVSLAEYISELLKPLVMKEFEEMHRQKRPRE